MSLFTGQRAVLAGNVLLTLAEGLKMPYIRVSCLTGALNHTQKATLASRLADVVMGQEIEPLTEIGRAAAAVFFDEIDEHNWFPGGVSLLDHPEKQYFVVEAVVAASFFNQSRRDIVQAEVAAAFVAVLGDDGTSLEREGVTVSPAYLMRLHTAIIEIPEGSWGAGGRTVDTELIGKFIGAGQGPSRFAEARALGAKMKAARQLLES
jgi:phenylpyruvate tautomerase PptA (4-oxalocrotonate tautomerase family)